jgi:hypothetical protein
LWFTKPGANPRRIGDRLVCVVRYYHVYVIKKKLSNKLKRKYTTLSKHIEYPIEKIKASEPKKCARECFLLILWKKKFKQSWLSIPPISTKRTITHHLSLFQKIVQTVAKIFWNILWCTSIIILYHKFGIYVACYLKIYSNYIP